jgi:integrase
MNIHFVLRAQGAADPKIILRVFDSRFHLRNFMYSTGLSISPNQWDKRKNRPKISTYPSDELNRLIKHLNKIESAVKDFLSERNNSKTIAREDLKAHIEKSLIDEVGIKNEKATKENQFFSIWAQIINTTKYSGISITDGTKRSKTQTLNLIKRFAAENSQKLSFETIDMKFYHSFDEYMNRNGLNINTRGKHFKEIKAVLREAEDRDIIVNHAFRKKSFKVMRTNPDNVYLNTTEIVKLYNLKLTAAQEKLRDIFVMACYVGARHSDWRQINQENIIIESVKEMLRIKQTKTGAIVHVPIHTAVRTILKKYGNNIPKVISNQKFNTALKLICQKADLGKVIIEGTTVEKWQEITTHTARRSFATNAYLSRSMDVYQIMRFTGHKSESSFLRYLKLDGKDFAIQSADSIFFQDEGWSSLKIAN